MSLVDDLRAAKAKIAEPIHWCRRSLAIDGRGQQCAEKFGIAWCTMGALHVVDDPGAWGEAYRALLAALPEGFDEIGGFNDQADHHEVMALFDRAIAAAEVPA